MALFDKKVKSEQKTTKSFNYTKSGVTLAFSLTIDDKQQLQPFLEMLAEATEDVQAELDRLETKE